MEHFDITELLFNKKLRDQFLLRHIDSKHKKEKRCGFQLPKEHSPLANSECSPHTKTSQTSSSYLRSLVESRRRKSIPPLSGDKKKSHTR